MPENLRRVRFRKFHAFAIDEVFFYFIFLFFTIPGRNIKLVGFNSLKVLVLVLVLVLTEYILLVVDSSSTQENEPGFVRVS